ncbi:MAG: type II secretion system protein GspN [Myxococcales bacterium]|nr:type II secretion system protein GspN [Myxococcales bacterium]
MKTALRRVGYVLFFVVATLFFIWATFPTDRVKRFAEQTLSERLNADVSIADLSLAGIGGVSAEGVTLTWAPIKMPTIVPGTEEDGPLRMMLIDELDASAGISALLGGRLDLTADMKLQGGSIEGLAYQTEKGEDGVVRHVIKIGEMKDVAFGSEQLFQTLIGKDLIGTLSGSIDLVVPTAPGPNGRPAVQFDGMVGTVDLVIRDAVLQTWFYDTPAGRMKFTNMDLGEIVLSLKVDKAVNIEAFEKSARRRGATEETIIHFAEGSVKGEDIEVEVAKNSAITIQPGQSLKEAAVNIHLAVRIKDAYFDKVVEDPKNPGKTTQPNKNLRMVMNQRPIQPVLENGVFGLGITGRLGSPRVRPERSVIRTGLTGGSARRPNLDVGGDEADEEDSAPVVTTPRPNPTGRLRAGSVRPTLHPNAPRPELGGTPPPIPTPPPTYVPPKPVITPPNPPVKAMPVVEPGGDEVEEEPGVDPGEPGGEPGVDPDGEVVPGEPGTDEGGDEAIPE